MLHFASVLKMVNFIHLLDTFFAQEWAMKLCMFNLAKNIKCMLLNGLFHLEVFTFSCLNFIY